MSCPRCGHHITPQFYCLGCGYVPPHADQELPFMFSNYIVKDILENNFDVSKIPSPINITGQNHVRSLT